MGAFCSIVNILQKAPVIHFRLAAFFHFALPRGVVWQINKIKREWLRRK